MHLSGKLQEISPLKGKKLLTPVICTYYIGVCEAVYMCVFESNFDFLQ